MKKSIVMLAGILLLCMTAFNTQAADDIKSKVIGKWEITVPDAPEGLQKYTVIFKEKDGAILMDFDAKDSNLKNQKFTEKDGKLSANIYIEESVKVLIWEEKGVLKGTADTSMGLLPLKFKKL